MIELAARHPEMTFLLAGGEPADVARYQSQAESRRLENVILTGFIANSDLPLYQAACDVLLMPYQAQVAASSGGDIAAFLSPMKLFEYLASGRAILSSDLPVLREVLNPANAVLLDPEDINSWSAALRTLQDDPLHRESLGQQARRDASAYTWEARARAILAGLEASHA
jgi:glycosyltransferase involved in cell wall biosynthesis